MRGFSERKKRCRTCLKYKPFPEFEVSKNPMAITGRRASCKSCETETRGADWKEEKERQIAERKKQRDTERLIKRITSLSKRKKELSLEISNLTTQLNKIV